MITFAVSMLATATPAAADPPSGSTPVKVYRLNWCHTPYCRQAERQQQQGDLEGALDTLDHIANDPIDQRAWLVYFAIAAINLQLGKLRDGLQALDKYQEFVGKSPTANLPAGQGIEDVEQLSQALRAQFGFIEVHGGPPEAEVKVDDEVAGKLPLSTRWAVEPGRHRVAITTVEGVTFGQSFPVAVRETRIINLDSELPRPRSTPAPPPLRAPLTSVSTQLESQRVRPSPRRLTVGYATLGIGIATTLFGIGLMAVHGSCLGCTTPGRDFLDTIELGSVVLAGGLVILTTGIVLINLPGRRPVKPASL